MTKPLTISRVRELIEGLPGDTVVECWQGSQNGTTMRVALEEQTVSILRVSNGSRFVIYGLLDDYESFRKLVHGEKL